MATAADPELIAYVDAAFRASFDGPIDGPTPSGITPLKDIDGQLVQSTVAQDGFSAQAFLTKDDQLIVAFAGTDFDALAVKSDPNQELAVHQVIDDYMLYQGYDPPAFKDALNFVRQAEIAAAGVNVPTSAGNVFVDGHSLGGAIAAYVAAQDGLPGVTFAAPGLPPGDIPSGADGANVTAYVEYGDPIGNYAEHPDSDGSLVYNEGIDRYGTPKYIGSQDPSELAKEIKDLSDAATAYASHKAVGLFEFAVDAVANHFLVKYADDLGIATPDKEPHQYSPLQLYDDIQEIIAGAASARLAVSLDQTATFTDPSTAVLTGHAVSPIGARSVDISAEVDGATTPTVLGAATLNPDGTFSFTDVVGSHTQSDVTATATDAIGNTATSQAAPFLLSKGSASAVYGASAGAGDGLSGFPLSRSADSNVVEISAPGQAAVSDAYDVFENGGRGGTTFVFTPGFGVDVVRGFKAAGADHDQLVLPSSDFRSLAAVFRNTGDVNGSAFITDPKTGDAIRLAGVTTAELKAHLKDVTLFG